MFVPVIHQPPQRRVAPPSAESRALADHLAESVRAFRDAHPGVSGGDLRRAFRTAESELLSEELPARASQPNMVAALVGGLTLAAGLGVFLYMRQASPDGPVVSQMMIVITIGVLGLLGVVAALMRR